MDWFWIAVPPTALCRASSPPAAFVHPCLPPPCPTPRRKENQVYTAEEKAALAMVNFEENKKKEVRILEEMRRLVDRTLGQGGEDEEEVGPAAPPPE